MPRKKIIDEVLDNAPDPVVEAPVVEEVVEKAVKTSGSASVIDKDGNFIREYSLEVHGKDYAALAKQFADKKGYSLI